MKKFVNDPRHIVRESLEGFVSLNAGLALIEGENIVVRKTIPAPAQRKVAVISGGGSGHEPAHAGYVGEGMLDAAVAGDVFTSPSVDAILAAILAVSGPAGALLVVKNYTGDRLNFALAAELAKAQGIPVEIVVVADDVALQKTVPLSRRRGIAGTVFVHKLAGAAAAQGVPLSVVRDIAATAAANVATMGLAFGPCTLPGVAAPNFTLAEDEVEFGLGIHGERGVRRAAIQPADALVAQLLEQILDDLAARDIAVREGVVALVNGLGGTPQMELNVVTRAVLAQLSGRGVPLKNLWVGNYMTALEMPGCSVSLLPVDAAMLAALNQPTMASAWCASAYGDGAVSRIAAPPVATSATTLEGPAAGREYTDRLRRAVAAIARTLTAAEPVLTDLDARAGDGDLGISMCRAAEAMRVLPEAAFANPETLLSSLAQALRKAIGGSSGPFYAVALMRASRVLRDQPEPTAGQWREALAAAIASVSELGGAQAGDRTMLDALIPALAALQPESGGASLARVATAAEQGAQATAAMYPRLGRASYLGERAVGSVDGGAMAVALWLRAIADELK